jgi:hypothetical protein
MEEGLPAHRPAPRAAKCVKRKQGPCPLVLLLAGRISRVYVYTVWGGSGNAACWSGSGLVRSGLGLGFGVRARAGA